MKIFTTVQEIADYCGVCRRTIRRMRDAGELPAPLSTKKRKTKSGGEVECYVYSDTMLTEVVELAQARKRRYGK
jgi:excisionase family DNA binding protein